MCLDTVPGPWKVFCRKYGITENGEKPHLPPGRRGHRGRRDFKFRTSGFRREGTTGILYYAYSCFLIAAYRAPTELENFVGSGFYKYSGPSGPKTSTATISFSLSPVFIREHASEESSEGLLANDECGIGESNSIPSLASLLLCCAEENLRFIWG